LTHELLFVARYWSQKGKEKVKVTWIYIAPSRQTSKALRRAAHSFTCKLGSVREMAPPLTVVADI